MSPLSSEDAYVMRVVRLVGFNEPPPPNIRDYTLKLREMKYHPSNAATALRKLLEINAS